MRGSLAAITALCAAAIAMPVSAVNKCVGKNGEVAFSDRPCPLPPGVRTPDPVAGASAPRGDGQLTAAERKAIVDNMNAQVARGIAKREEELAKQAAAEAAMPKAKSSSQPMDFDTCRRFVARSLLAVAGATKTFAIVNTPSVTMHKICTSDGSVLLTCSAEDAKLITTASPYACP